MTLKVKLYAALAVILALLGGYIIVRSGQVQFEPFSTTVFLLAAGSFLYLYLVHYRGAGR